MYRGHNCRQPSAMHFFAEKLASCQSSQHAAQSASTDSRCNTEYAAALSRMQAEKSPCSTGFRNNSLMLPNPIRHMRSKCGTPCCGGRCFGRSEVATDSRAGTAIFQVSQSSPWLSCAEPQLKGRVRMTSRLSCRGHAVGASRPVRLCSVRRLGEFRTSLLLC